jgi:hypothetical protein
MHQTDWNEWLTFIAALTLLLAILIPFTQRKYEEWKAKISFHLYLKKYFGILNNILTYDKVEYHLPSINDNPEKSPYDFGKYINEFERDFKEHRDTTQYRIAFALIFNLQNILFAIYRVQNAIRIIDVDKLYEQTLAYGNNLTKSELNRIYGILLLAENFTSITTFHDRFRNMHSIQRDLDKDSWLGLKVNKTLLSNQNLILEDLRLMRDNELSLQEIITVSKLLIQELKTFYEFDKLNKKRSKSISSTE